MNRFLIEINDKTNGWALTWITIFLELILVYVISNFPFVLSALEVPSQSFTEFNFMEAFGNILKDEVSNKGQLLTFVCALIAPVVFWSMMEFKKAIAAKILVLLSLILVGFCAYVHGKGAAISSINSYNIYVFAIIVWIFSVLAKEIPPKRPSYGEIANNELSNFVNATRK